MHNGQLLVHHGPDASNEDFNVQSVGFLSPAKIGPDQYLPSFGSADLVKIGSLAGSDGLKVATLRLSDGSGRRMDEDAERHIVTDVRKAITEGDSRGALKLLRGAPNGAQIISITFRSPDHSQAELSREGHVRYSNKNVLKRVIDGLRRFAQNGE